MTKLAPLLCEVSGKYPEASYSVKFYKGNKVNITAMLPYKTKRFAIMGDDINPASVGKVIAMVTAYLHSEIEPAAEVKNA